MREALTFADARALPCLRAAPIMKKSLLLLCLALALQTPIALAKNTAKLGSFGIDTKTQDRNVDPGDDFDRYANGSWFQSYQLKDYEVRHTSFSHLADQAELQTRTLIEALLARDDLAPGSNEQKVRDYYSNYLDTKARDVAGIKPLNGLLKQIGEIKTVADLTAAFGRASVDRSISPISAGVTLDRKDPDRYLISIGASGLGLPDKDFYFNADARFAQIRAAYVKHIATMLRHAGLKDTEKRAAAVLALETSIAEHHWERSQLRDRDRTYNVMPFAQLLKRFPGHDWKGQLAAQGIDNPGEINVSTPSAINPIVKVIEKTPLTVWRDYLRFHVVDNHAPLLSTELGAASFAFNGTVLNGQVAQKELWKRAVAQVGDMSGLGDAVGEWYVERHFKPEAKAAMDQLVANLRAALRQNIKNLDWMGEETKLEAYKKLDTFRPKIGYTEKWRDYSKVEIVKGDLLGNVRALLQFARDEQNARLGTKPDRGEWFMTPQAVNAYYNASFNEIVFPAAILQPPFFDLHADPAVNYGAIGGVIGHEMGHGFDDQGSKSDSAGVQRNWWSDADRARFDARTKALVEQYNGYCPLKGHCINGQLALGENIGDLGGLSMAYTAYRLSLNGKEAPIIDGLSGDQRFFLAWAQVWKSKFRDEAMINQVKVGPHSPPRFRINGPLRNLDKWYEAFDVKKGDALYLAPEQRVRIW